MTAYCVVVTVKSVRNDPYCFIVRYYWGIELNCNLKILTLLYLSIQSLKQRAHI